MLVFSPAGMEGFFAEVGAPSPAALARGRAALVAAQRFGWQFLADE